MPKTINNAYIKDDFQIINKTEFDDTTKVNMQSEFRYTMLFVLNGKAEVKIKNTDLILNKDEFILINTNVPYSYNLIKTNESETLIIRIHPSNYKKLYDDEYFLRTFDDKEFIRQKFNMNDVPELHFIKESLINIKKCLQKKLGRAHLLPRVQTIISELCLYYDEKHPHENVSTDSIPVKIIDYIERHYLENITYDTIISKFGVSVPTLNSIMRSFKDCTLRQYVEYLRLKDAKTMMDHSINSAKIAELCGFNSYSTFYRAYKKLYGTTPCNDNNKTEKKWPLTH